MAPVSGLNVACICQCVQQNAVLLLCLCDALRSVRWHLLQHQQWQW
jgi:hypothetical protein